jgi:hypothetical protein
LLNNPGDKTLASFGDNYLPCLMGNTLGTLDNLGTLGISIADLGVTNTFIIAMENEQMRWSIRRKEIVSYDICSNDES